MSKALLETTLEAVQDGVLVVDLDGRILAYNGPFLALWGIPQDVAREADDEELLSHAADRLDDPGTFLSKVRELYEETERASTDLVWFDDGRVVKRWSYPFGVGDEPAGRVWTFRDVTDEIESRQAASQATRKLRQIVEAAPVAVITVDRSGRITTWNPAAEQILGHEANEILGTPFASLGSDDGEASGGLAEHIAAALDGHRQQGLPVTYHPPSANPRILELSYGPVETGGDTLGVVVIASDRTEEHRAHEALAKLEQRHAAWLEVAPDVTVTLDTDGCITSLNPAFEEITGWDREAWIGRAFIDLVHPDDTDALVEGYQSALDGQEPLATTFRYEASDGSWRWASALGRPVIEDDEIVDFFAIVRDVTEERHRQEEAHRGLRRQVEIERLEAQASERQELVATTAHELSKPLTPMRFQLATLRMVLGPEAGADEGVEEAIEGLEHSLARLERLVDDLSRASEAEREAFVIEPEILPLDEIVLPVARSYRPAADEKGLRLDLEQASKAVIEADPQRLEQVVANLVENAIKFTEPDGSIRVTVDRAEGYGRLVVADTGQGLTEAQMAGLFQPFSQVHEGHDRGSGSGLGLYVTKAIVEAHGGRIWCESAGPNEGATFHAQFPLASSAGGKQMLS